LASSKVIFGISLIALMISLGISFREIQVSVDALHYRLSDLEGSFPTSPQG
jgi:hypothetical protein